MLFRKCTSGHYRINYSRSIFKHTSYIIISGNKYLKNTIIFRSMSNNKMFSWIGKRQIICVLGIS